MTNSTDNYPAPLHFDRPPRRVVSLVPSMTESLFDLGFGEAVVGITDYCLYPANSLAGLPRLGGPKHPRIEDILALQPDLVLANWEENTRLTVEKLDAAGVPVWVTFPVTVAESLEILWKLVELFRSPQAVLKLKFLETSVEWARAAAAEWAPRRYFCPIWFDQTQAGQTWWMTFNQYTYCHDLLALLGGENCFGERQRRYPLAADLDMEPPRPSGERDTRYPRVSRAEILRGAPEIILLPSEPFEFEEHHRQAMIELLAGTPAADNQRIYLVDGSLITWHGTRLAHALQDLPSFFNN